MRSLLIEVQAPRADFLSGMSKIPEPMFIKALISKFSIEALDVAVLHRLAGLDQLQLNAMVASPLMEGFAGEFRPLISSHGLRIASELRNTIQEEVDRSLDALFKTLKPRLDNNLRKPASSKCAFHNTSKSVLRPLPWTKP